MSQKLLEDYAAAWNDHDIDRIMWYMTDDCVFETGGGTERYGTRHAGYERVRERFLEVIEEYPDVSFENAIHFCHGNLGCSEWTFTTTAKDGGKVEIDGCDIFSIENDKIKSKRSYLKNRR